MATGKKIESVEDLEVYQTFFDLALQVETTTKGCNGDFRWLRVQALRSSESVCANLTEGFYLNTAQSISRPCTVAGEKPTKR